MLDVRLFRNARFSAASLSVTLVFFALMGVLFFLTQYLQGVLGLTALETGIRFVPLAIGIILSAPVSAWLTRAIGAKVATAAGLLVTAGALLLLATVSIESGDLLISAVLAIGGFGMGVAMTPATDAIMGALPKAQAGVGSAVNDTTREIGGALGVAILGSIFSGAFAERMADASRGLPADVGAAVRDSIGGALVVAERVGGTTGELIAAAARSAFVEAMATAALIGAAVAVAGAVVAFVWLPARASQGEDAPASTAPSQAGHAPDPVAVSLRRPEATPAG
jgi:Na+/melibiose symporter-like transporter